MACYCCRVTTHHRNTQDRRRVKMSGLYILLGGILIGAIVIGLVAIHVDKSQMSRIGSSLKK